MKGGAIRIGTVGAGGFGLSALQHFTQIPGVELIAMAETHRELLRVMMRDQVRWIYDRNHVRKVTHENGRDSLAVAVAAAKLAEQST
jgi:predicted homoserine dehydrogenase-like protein